MKNQDFRLRGHYVADIRSGICDPNARPTVVKETAGKLIIILIIIIMTPLQALPL